MISYCLTFDLSKPQLFIDTDLNEWKRKFSTNTNNHGMLTLKSTYCYIIV